jgi:hypothetical protein
VQRVGGFIEHLGIAADRTDDVHQVVMTMVFGPLKPLCQFFARRE